MCKICDEYIADERLVKIKDQPIKIGELLGCLNLELWMNEGSLNSALTDLNGNIISEFHVPIKYCPFCGVTLDEMEES